MAKVCMIIGMMKARLRPGKLLSGLGVVGRGLHALGPLALVGHVCLVRFVELGQELDIRNQGMNLLKNISFHSQVCIVIPDLQNYFVESLVCVGYIVDLMVTCIMSSLSLGDTDSPQISSPWARDSSNCSPMEARSSSFHTLTVSCFLHFIRQVPPLQMCGSSHSGGRSSRMRW